MSARGSLNNPTIRFVLFAAILTGVWLFGQAFHVDIAQIRAQLSQYPLILSGLLFVVIYTVVTFFVWFGTIDFFRITAALLFGGIVSSVLVWLAELLNAFTLFHLSRKLGRDFVVEKFRLRPKDLTRVSRRDRAWGVFALRINPLVPFRFMDIGFGLSGIKFQKYFSGIFLASFVRIFWLQSILAGIGEGLLQRPGAMMDYLSQNPQMILASGVYFLVVLAATIAAAVRR